ncbi:hypothetical protein V5799_003241, partial [Amblyomma americanum]
MEAVLHTIGKENLNEAFHRFSPPHGYFILSIRAEVKSTLVFHWPKQSLIVHSPNVLSYKLVVRRGNSRDLGNILQSVR